MPGRKRVFMVTRQSGPPPDHTKSPARGYAGAGAAIGRASGDASGAERKQDGARC